MEVDDVDHDALTRAVEMYRADPARSEQLDYIIKRDGWVKAAEFAAYSAQSRSLHLRPWQSPPCHVGDIDATLAKGDDGVLGDYAAAKLLQKMLALGISEFEPDPLAAIERAEGA
jgi:hypothetical protein